MHDADLHEDPDSSDRRERWARVARSFDALVEADPAERAARLAQLERDDPALAAEVASLLDADAASEDFLERPALDLSQAGPGGDELPERIGPYRVLERLGRGGSGTVYRGRRDDGALDQVVAIKVVHAPGDPDRMRRFEQEARVLSRLDHPGIARPIDAGRLDAESGYLVMEYVDGVRIDRYCDEHGLSADQRLELLARVCDAVQFAHRNLVVHRDVKPANVLVDRSGQPRLLDFGIARMLEATADPELTRTGQLALTPQYASPEQFTGAAITTAADVYGLGALGYRLLCGRPPLDLDGLGLTELLDRVRDAVPSAPSEAADQPELRGDVDAILMTALRKEPERRYASAGELAADLRRHLAGAPVSAHADSWRYRMGKFLRRHRLAVTSGALAALALALLSAIATVQALRADEARRDAELEANRAVQVLGFFQRMLGSADPARAQGEEPRVRDLLDRTAQALPDSGLDPLARATVQETVASTYLALGQPDAGLALAESAAATLAEELGADHPRTLAARHAEARFHLYAADYDRAISILEPTLEARRRVLGDSMDTMSTLHNLSYAYAGRGETERALELDRLQLEIVERLSGPGSPEALTTLLSIGHGLFELGRIAEAREVFRQVHEGQRAQLGARHPTTLSALHNLATMTRRLGEIDAAEVYYLELIALRRDVLGDRHAQTLNSMNNLGELYLHSHRPDDAAPWIELGLSGRLEALGEAHPDSIDSRIAHASLMLALGDPATAEQSARRALALATEHLGEDSPYTEKARDALDEATGGAGHHGSE